MMMMMKMETGREKLIVATALHSEMTLALLFDRTGTSLDVVPVMSVFQSNTTATMTSTAKTAVMRLVVLKSYQHQIVRLIKNFP